MIDLPNRCAIIRSHRALQADLEVRMVIEEVRGGLQIDSRGRAGMASGTQILVLVDELRRFVVFEMTGGAARFPQHLVPDLDGMTPDRMALDTGLVGYALEPCRVAGIAIAGNACVHAVNRTGQKEFLLHEVGQHEREKQDEHDNDQDSLRLLQPPMPLVGVLQRDTRCSRLASSRSSKLIAKS